MTTVPRPPLTLCGIGAAGPSHVQARTRCFAQRGHRVILVTDAAAGTPGVTEVVPRPSIDHPRLCGISFVWNAMRAIRKTDADIVHVHFAHGLLAWLAPAVTNRPLVVSVMGGDVLFEERGRTKAERELTTRMLRSADLITAKSAHLTEAVNRIAPDVPCIRVMWGVDTKRFQPGNTVAARTAVGIPPDARVILCPKALTPFYNADRLIEALPRVARRHPSVRLALMDHVPDVPYRTRLLERARDLGVSDRIHLLPDTPNDEMPRCYAMADIAVSVPASDGLPQSLLEGLACGVVNVLPRHHRYEDIVTHGETAWMVDPTPEGLADAFDRLLAADALRQKIAAAGRHLVEERWDFAAEVLRIEKLYQDLAPRRGRRSAIDRLTMLFSLLRHLAGRPHLDSHPHQGALVRA